MLQGIIDWLRNSAPPEQTREEPDSIAAQEQPLNVKAPDRLGDPGFLEAHMSGWCLKESAELFQGFSINASDTVMDVGCGDGNYIKFCANLGADVIFADIDETKVAAVAKLVSKTPAQIACPLVTDTNPLPLRDQTASKIVAMEVLEHVEDPASFMKELYRVGTKDARYLITVPDPVGETLQQQLAPPEYFAKPNHIRIFQRDEIDKLLTDTGLVIEQKTYYGFYWCLWWLLFWTADGDLGKPPPPILESWGETWHRVLKSEQGAHVKKVLDEFMPKSQVLIARK